jgi:hypothetical protein
MLMMDFMAGSELTASKNVEEMAARGMTYHYIRRATRQDCPVALVYFTDGY